MGGSMARLRYVGLLRGVNLGKRQMRMERLREVVAGLGYTGVTTYIASGNVLLDAPAREDPAGLERRIESALQEAFGFPVDTMLRTCEQMAAAVAFQPFDAADMDDPEKTIHVGFLRTELDPVVEGRLLAFRTEKDEFRVLGREFFWLCRGRTLDSLVKWPKIEKAVGMASTMRNIKTVRKLAELCATGP
ncbi:DUF1697 domain-containing protein [Aquisphaera insulae]|uniref:DUF1697 domain-containing protein n=1 Tax=Aquisphaera insulae TaxID=2712864 RepID=UPI0013EDFCB0|nr:DUF1697 domain-containing protein [Aquisphaera insulae]